MDTYSEDDKLKAVFAPEAISALGAAQAGIEIGCGEQALLIGCCGRSQTVFDLIADDMLLFAVAPDQYLQGYMAMLNVYYASHNELLHPMNSRAKDGENLWQVPCMDSRSTLIKKRIAYYQL